MDYSALVRSHITFGFPKPVGHPGFLTARHHVVAIHGAEVMTWEELRQVPAPAGFFEDGRGEGTCCSLVTGC